MRAVRRRARPRVHLERQPALPRVHPGRAHQGVAAVRHRGLGVGDRRRVVAGGGAARSTRRTRRCGGSPTSPVSPPARAGASSRAGRPATSRRSWPHADAASRGAAGSPGALAGRGRRPGALVARDHAAASWTSAPLVVPTERRPADRRRAARRARGRRRPGVGVRGGRHRGHDQRGPRSTTSPASPRSPASTTSGCTSTARTGSPRSPRRRVRDHFAGHRARRLVRRRSAQVAVRAVRLRRAPLPRARSSPRRAHAQRRVVPRPDPRDHEWNPADYAYHLTRRVRGLPFWFSLAVHGTDAYTDRDRARRSRSRDDAARRIDAAPHLELVLRARADGGAVAPARAGRRADYARGPKRTARGAAGVRPADDLARRDRGPRRCSSTRSARPTSSTTWSRRCVDRPEPARGCETLGRWRGRDDEPDIREVDGALAGAGRVRAHRAGRVRVGGSTRGSSTPTGSPTSSPRRRRNATVRDYIADQATLRLARTSNFVSAARPIVTDAVSRRDRHAAGRGGGPRLRRRARTSRCSGASDARRVDVDSRSRPSITIRSALQTINPSLAKKLPANVLDATTTDLAESARRHRCSTVEQVDQALYSRSFLVGRRRCSVVAMVKARDRVQAIRDRRRDARGRRRAARRRRRRDARVRRRGRRDERPAAGRRGRRVHRGAASAGSSAPG